MLAQVGRRAIGHNVAFGDQVADLDHRPLVDIGVLIGAGVFGQVVDIDANLTRHSLGVVDADDDTVSIDVVDYTATQGLHSGTGVDRHGALDAGADQRLLGTQARHRLALHVGAH